MITLQEQGKADRRSATSQVRIIRLWLTRAGSTKRTIMKPAHVAQSVTPINASTAKRPLEAARPHWCVASVSPKSP